MARSPRSGHRRLLLVLALAVVLLLALHASPVAAEDAAGGGSGSGSKPKGRADLPFWPPSQQDAAGILLIGLGLLIAAGGGIGGGGIIVALLILVQGCTPQQAIPISNVTVLGGAIANTISAARSRHPYATHRPLIDFDVVLLMEPPTVLGALMGTFLNKLLPSVVVVILLVVVLGAMGYRTLRKGLAILKAEGGVRGLFRVHNEQEAEQVRAHAFSSSISTMTHHSPSRVRPAAAAAGAAAAKEPAAAVEMGAAGPAISTVTWTEDEEDPEAESAAKAGAGAGAGKKLPIQYEEVEPIDDLDLDNLGPPVPTFLARKSTLAVIGTYFSPQKVGLLLTMFCGVVALTIARGFMAKRDCGSLGYWLISTAVIPWTLGFFLALRRVVLGEVVAKAAAGYEPIAGDVQWTPRLSLIFPTICSIAGMMAGLFGVGGGIVKGPLMLEMGILPPVVAACSASMILMTSTAATLSFVTFKMLKWDWALAYFIFGFCCTTIGDRTVKVLLRKYKKQSPIVLSIGIVVVLAAVLMTGLSIKNIVKDPSSLTYIGQICPSVHEAGGTSH